MRILSLVLGGLPALVIDFWVTLVFFTPLSFAGGALAAVWFVILSLLGAVILDTAFDAEDANANRDFQRLVDRVSDELDRREQEHDPY
jgi:hypothetical protein